MFFNPETGQNELWCKSWFESFLRVQSLTYGTALIVVVVNLLFRRLLKPVVKFEHVWYVAHGSPFRCSTMTCEGARFLHARPMHAPCTPLLLQGRGWGFGETASLPHRPPVRVSLLSGATPL